MDIRIAEDGVRAVLRPEGDLNIYRAVEFRDALLKAIAGHGDLDLDCTAISEFDSAGLQMLLAARREIAAAGGRLRLISPGAALLDVLRLSGVDGRFEIAP